MKSLFALALALLPVAVAAAPVHVSLKSSASVQTDADFLLLGSVATLSGGDPLLRARLAKVPVGRVPLAGDIRHLTRGDLALKLRQAGFQPSRDALLDGATGADVTTAASGVAPPAPNSGGGRGEGASTRPAPPELGAGGAVIHRGDPVTIRIDEDALSITARGVARENGVAGASIRVHREGCVDDLTVTVLDAQTVQLEM